MIISIIKENWSEITLTIGGIASFFAGRKSKKNSEFSGELGNIEKVREIEKRLLRDMEEQIKKLIDTNNFLEKLVDEANVKIRAYEKKYGALKK